ncbi:MAG: esterase-like activity of phytase family protein [Xenococcaceae cyanobacterium MO_207.B15]|nr:esterase-like activity of phytase family protein [Xenococcaceae cyanobacterium MO_207.B15]
MNSDSIQTTLVGFASLPADTFAEGPPSGADNGNGEPISRNGRTGPFEGQPVQGFSGVQFAPSGNGAFWVLSDNGFGGQSNSADYLLRLYQVDPSFAGAEEGDGSVEVQGFVQLSDPNNLIPFEIINEGTEERWLTGGDFDVESFVIDSNGDIWVGDEFGPYLLHFNSEGELLKAPIPTPNITNFNTLNGQDPFVIGHRGASGVLPEHTLEAYATAIAQGADFIEPDLVITKDGVLIARHEPMLDDTTNVAEVFGEERKSTKILDGEEVTAYFAEDFTLEEIKMLRAVQSRPYRSQDFNGAFEIPTFAEVIELVQQTEAQTGVKVGIYPETKHPTFFDLQDLSLEKPLIETLQETGFTDSNRIFIQSFEFQNLIELQGMLDEVGLGDIPLVQLYGNTTEDASPDEGFSVPYDIRYNLEQGKDLAAIYGQEFLDAVENGISENTTYRDLDNAEILQIISDKYAEGAGPWKNNILLRESLDEPVDGNGDGVAEITTQLTGEVTSFIEDAHAAGLQVHPYTHRNEERFLTLNPDGTPQTPEAEVQQLIEIGADGFFTDFPATGAAVVDSLAGEFVQSPQNPDLGDGIANLSPSRGFEGMAFSPDRMTLYPLLEGTVEGDPENALRIYEFDVATSSYTGLVGYYPTTNGNPIGDFTPINDTEFLVIERDGRQGEEAEFKKIFKIDISNVDKNGFVEKTEVVDLLNIADPNDLNGDGSTTFDFPFVTIEDVVIVDENTILVANDNNYPFSMGREGDIDNNEVILIELSEPLDLDPNLGGNAFTPTFLINDGDTAQASQMTGLNDYEVDPFFTIGEQFGDYAPPGIPDGLGAFALDDDTIRILANHELRANAGYTYTLANGTELTGARVSFFDINKETLQVEDAGLAYDTIINRAGKVVDEASDLEFQGIQRLCSAQYISAHQFGEGRGLENAMFFTGEETFGGTEFVIDSETNTMYAVPWMGRAAWESVTELDTGTTDKVALLIGDDREAAPLLMYVGEKDTSEDADFLARNGLSNGKLYAWKPDGDIADTPTFLDEDGDEVDADDAPDPFGFNGTGNSLSGTWIELDYYRPDLAGTAVDTDDDGRIQDEMGYDEMGFATQAQQDQLFIDAGGFQFSRPEDVSTNPSDGTVAVLASTGRDSRFSEDSWGTTYKIDVDFSTEGNPVTAQIDILYDGDDAGAGKFEGSDFGLRSPDNLDWADDGQIYIQEDRSFREFGLTSGEEASIWRLDPETGALTRIAQMDRFAVPEGQTDGDPDDIGDWESSGILDVSELFGEDPGTRFIFGVQAHSLRDGIIETEGLVEGGQLAFLTQEEDDSSELYDLVFGTTKPDIIEVNDSNQIIIVVAGEGDDLIDLSFDDGNNRVFGDGGDDTFILGTSDRLSGSGGSDRFFVGSGGDNTISGGEGADEFWIATAQIPESANIITDFTSDEDVIGIAGLGISFEDLTFTDSELGAVVSVDGNELAVFTNTNADFISNEQFFVIV